MKTKSLLLFLALIMDLAINVSAAPAGATKPAPAQSAGKEPADKKAGKGAPKPYPLDVCIVTDNDLGSMGEETEMIHEGQVIKFCCKPCEKKFLRNPAKYLEKLAPKTN